MVRFRDNNETTVKFLRKILPELSSRNIPVTPYTYGLWYVIISAGNNKLRDEIDSLISEGSFTDETILRLYSENVVDDLLILDSKVEESYQNIMTGVQTSAVKTKESARELEEDLLNSLGIVDSIDNGKDLKSMINNLSKKTKSVTDNTQEFQGILENANSEITRLKRELEKAKEEATRDVLTGLFNRRYFDNALTDALCKGTPAVFMVDVDFFKSFNDTYGHLTGDVVLKDMGECLRLLCSGKPAIPCRFGGEEFAVLVANASIGTTQILSEKIRRAVCEMELFHAENHSPIKGVTASIGVAFGINGDTIKTLVERADKALYVAKKSGRNQVVVA